MRTTIIRACVIVGLSAGTLGLWPPSAARACSIAACSLGYAAPRGGAIPANAPALVYVAPPQTDNTPATSVLLMTADGQQSLPFTWQLDPAAAGQFLIMPATPLQPDASYRLVGVGSCPGGRGQDLNAPFSVGPPQDLPASIGTVVVHPPETNDLDVPGGPSCVERHRVAAVFLETSFILGNYAPLTQIRLTVDGQAWGDSSYGSALGGDNPTYPYAVCDTPYPGYGLRPGHHHGELSIHVAGAPSDPAPVAFDFDLDCSAPSVLAPPPAAGSGGCALGGAPVRDAFGWLVGLCLLALLTGRGPRPARARCRRPGRGGSSAPARRNAGAGVYFRA